MPWRRGWAVLGVAYLALISFPGDFAPVRPGLDAGWQYAINYVPNSAYGFGRDVVFTAGPLGYLLHPLNIGANLPRAVVFRLGVHAVFVALAAYWAFGAGDRWSVLFFVGAYTVALALDLRYEYHLLVVMGMLLCLPPLPAAARSASALVAGAMASTFFFMKLSLGVAAFGMLAMWGAAQVLKDRRRCRRALLPAALGALGCGGAWAVLVFSAWGEFGRWLKASLDIAGGYSSAMSIDGRWQILALGAAALAAYALAAAGLLRARSPAGLAALILGVGVLLGFKHGFARQDSDHVTRFFPFVLASIAALGLASRGRNERVLVVAAFGAALVFGAPVIGGYHFFRKSFLTPGAVVLGVQGCANLAATLRLTRTRAELDRRAARELAGVKLPPEWVRMIRERGGTVDVIPWEIAYCPANGLPWSPAPTLQMYSAYTPFLDGWTARHFDGDEAPAFLLVEFRDIDLRNVMWSAPAAWRTILRNYDAAGCDATLQVLLLKRRPRPREGVVTSAREVPCDLGEWTDVPPSEGLMFASVDFRAHLGGAVAKALFRIPPVYVELQREDGERWARRMVPANGIGGLLINRLPTSLEELQGLFSGPWPPRVVRFRVFGPGIGYYHGTLKCVWMEWVPRGGAESRDASAAGR